MMKYVIPVVGLIMVLFLFSFQTPQSTSMSETYPKEWAKIDSLEQQGLPRSALQEVEKLYERAKKDQNAAQIVKSLLYRSKYQSQLEEDGLVKVIYRLEEEAKGAAAPVQSILYSILGEMYQQYLEASYWQLSNRTDTPDFKSDDVRTWSVAQLSEASSNYYLQSLDDRTTATIPIEDIQAILHKGQNTAGLRPNLYDFLAHRAIDHFMNDRTYLSEPAYQFQLDRDDLFVDAEEFVQLTFSSRDTASYKLQALRLLQSLLHEQMKAEGPEPMIDTDLKRLKFVHQQAVLDIKDSLYLAALERLKAKYSKQEAVAEILYHMASLHFTRGSQYKAGEEENYKWERKKAHELCEEAIRLFPKSYGAGKCRALMASIETKALTLQTERVNLPNQPILNYCSYQNIQLLHLRVVRIPDAEREAFQTYRHEQKWAYLKAKKAIDQWKLDLPDDGDYQKHAIEFKTQSLPFGHYALLAADQRAFSHEEGVAEYLLFDVSEIGFLSRQMPQTGAGFVVVDRRSGEPLAGVKAEFFANEYNRSKRKNELKKVGEGYSDENGMLNPSLSKNTYYQIKFTRGQDVLFSSDRFSNYVSRSRREKARITHFFLDRAIYRPGQQVYFKGVVLENDLNGVPSIVSNEPVLITFYDANYQEVDKLELYTSEYGTVNGSFTAPKSGMLGRMHLVSSAGKTNKYFRVEEYKRPKFEVNIKPLEGEYRLGEEVTVEGNAIAFAGSNIDGAKVTYRVVREVRYPWWNWWRRGFYPTPGASTEIAFGETQTDVSGNFTITFEALPDRTVDRKNRPAFAFRVSADVTDITGETHTANRTLNLGYLSLVTELRTPVEHDLNDSLSLNINTRNLDGRFVAASGQLRIASLDYPETIFINRYWQKPDRQLTTEKEFKTDFPSYAFGKEDQKESWETRTTLYDQAFTSTEEGVLKISTQNWEPGHYMAWVEAKDNSGETVEARTYFTIYNQARSQFPKNQLKWSALDKKQYQPREMASLQLVSPNTPLHFLVEKEHRNQLTRTQWLETNPSRRLEYEVRQEDLGGFFLHLTYVKNNRAYTEQHRVEVPWSEKELSIEYATFRDKLRPGEEEEWKIKISGPRQDQVAAEMLVAMYDASLDEFARNSWSFNPYPNYAYARLGWRPKQFSGVSANWRGPRQSPFDRVEDREYPRLNWFNFSAYPHSGRFEKTMTLSMRSAAAPAAAEGMISQNYSEDAAAEPDMVVLADEAEAPPAGPPPPPEANQPGDDEPGEGTPQIRRNLNETVFFMPDLHTDAEGNVVVKFTMNEALTRWRFLGMAHTKDLAIGLTENTVVTQKELMVLPNPPRFLREGDEIEFTAKVSNLTDQEMQGTAELRLFDAITMKPIDELFDYKGKPVSFAAPGGQSARLAWNLKVPEGQTMVVTHRVVAKAGAFSDGEESALPVLSNRMLVTETLPLPVKGKETREFTMKSLKESTASSTLSHHNFTLEFTSNPAWYAVQALPYLMEYPYECAEQIFSRYYANSLATSVANAHPGIKEVFEKWKTAEVLTSNLEENQELKTILLEETPWVLQAQSEAQQKKNIGLLFDLNRMSEEQALALEKLAEMQTMNGGFSWFAGGRENWYITQYIVEGMGHLNALGVADVKSNAIGWNMTQNAIGFIDRRLVEHYHELEDLVQKKRTKWEDDHLSNLVIHYLYTRSFFPEFEPDEELAKIHKYYLGQADKYWLKKGLYQQGLIAMAQHRMGDKALTEKIIKSLKERALYHDELGMYWKFNAGYYWHQMPIETQALMVEVFGEVAQDEEAVEQLKIWLLKNKQTSHWKTTKATASAVYALLNYGDNWLLEGEAVKVSFPKMKKKSYADKLEAAINEAEAGTGYFKSSWSKESVGPEMGIVKVENPNKTIAWGGIYWQYFEDLDQIKTFEETPLTIKKKLFLTEASDRGPVLKDIDQGATLQPGDKLTVRIELRVDRDMEYVHMKDMRASGLEPINVLSTYRWQGGLGYYESTRDVATNFFFSYLPKGTYVFEYPLRVVHKGEFSNGITTIQSMYAPEFTSHSEGVRISVE